MEFVIALALLAMLAVILLPLLMAYRNMVTGRKMAGPKKAVLMNLAGFGVLCLLCTVLPLGGFASAASVSLGGNSVGMGYLAAAGSTAAACIAAGIAVSHGASAAIGAVTEDPKVFGRAMIFVVLGEGIAIYGLIVSFMILSSLR